MRRRGTSGDLTEHDRLHSSDPRVWLTADELAHCDRLADLALDAGHPDRPAALDELSKEGVFLIAELFDEFGDPAWRPTAVQRQDARQDVRDGFTYARRTDALREWASRRGLLVSDAYDTFGHHGTTD